ncbi:MAG: hypothetical protein A2266_08630 [Bacteroidetes bacterium RIFOXYA12_FULL_40_10]|nr:MAG: hypothetical protein A2266_08630 [Bacteroidetes bacterium RIFOXYA12_FULL_40_10]
MKTKSLIYLFSGLLTIGLVSCEKSDIPQEEILNTEVEILSVAVDGTTSFITTNLCPAFDTTADLTANEIEFLYAVREDEKLARDVYTYFFDKFELTPFSRIAKAEANHIAAVEKLFYFYSITYPAVGPAGEFKDGDRKAYYDNLIAKGVTALEAYKATAYLEEKDVADYTKVLETIQNANIKMVIENLLKGSVNHLKASVRQIYALNGTYAPAFLTQEKYDEIISNNSFMNGEQYKRKGNQNSTNAGNGSFGSRGAVNQSGDCTGTANGQAPGTCSQSGSVGKGYRGGR